LKKIIFLLLLITSILFGSDLKTQQKIYTLITHVLLPEKKEVKVWADSLSNRELMQNVPHTILVNSPQEADFILLQNHQQKGVHGLIFVTNLQLLRALQSEAIGGFFWQKGRPNILFLRHNLEKHHITLPSSMQEYIEDEL
jgi:hypothetical protein